MDLVQERLNLLSQIIVYIRVQMGLIEITPYEKPAIISRNPVDGKQRRYLSFNDIKNLSHQFPLCLGGTLYRYATRKCPYRQDHRISQDMQDITLVVENTIPPRCFGGAFLDMGMG